VIGRLKTSSDAGEHGFMTAAPRLPFALYRWAVGLAAAGVQSAIYFAVGHMSQARSTTLLVTELDAAIPFLPWTVWCYLPFYAGIFILAMAGLSTRRLFNRALAGIGAIMMVGATGHLLVAAAYPRPVVHPPYSDLSHAFLAWVQSIDPPGNVFPSLHVAHSSALAIILRHDRPRLGAAALVMAILLALSTLTTKQHFLADVAAGLIMGVGTSLAVLRGLDPTPHAP
jgi:membrane-associated phospholipid phosphatase